MAAERRSLKDYLDAARAEHSPFTAEDTAQIVYEAAVPGAARSTRMSPTLLATSAAALIIAAGVTVKVIHETDKKPQIAASTTSITTPPSHRPPAPSHRDSDDGSSTLTTVVADGGDDGSKRQRTMRVSVVDDRGETTSSDLMFMALNADDDIFRSLGLEATAVQAICKNLAGADSVTNCSFDQPEPQMRVCVFKDGSTDEVVFMDRPGPMPVMFTTSDGKGRVVASQFNRTADPNKLVPVATPGCGSTMLMWFEPTEEFVLSMPDSLSSELEQVIDMEVRITSKDGKTSVLARTRTPDSSATVIRSFDTTPDSLFSDANMNLLKELGQGAFDIQKMLTEIPALGDTLNCRPMVHIDTVRQDRRAIIRFRTDGTDDIKQMELELQSIGKDLKDFEIDMDDLNKNMEVLRNDLQHLELQIHMDRDSVKVRKMQWQRAPNIHRRVIVLSSNGRRSKPPTVPSMQPMMLQESRFAEGAVLNTSVFPNPTADGGATIGFELAEPRALTVELLNLNGERVLELARNVSRSSGNGQLAFALNGVAPGMYLVSLTTDRGERAVQRLIVE